MKNHVIIVTNDAEDAGVRRYKIKAWVIWTAVVVVCAVIGVMFGYILYEQRVWEVANTRIADKQAVIDEKLEIIAEKDAQIAQLEGEILSLGEQMGEQKVFYEGELQKLNDKINILSETVNKKTAELDALNVKFEAQYLPDEYPLTGSATMEESKSGDPCCIFTVSKGSTVVATAAGTVTAVNEDTEYGNSVWIDHGNGYITIYRNKGQVNVKLGDTVAQGTTIYIIGDSNRQFAYQMTKDGTYINPIDMLAISG